MSESERRRAGAWGVLWIGLVCWAVSISIVRAQPVLVTATSGAEFTASADHNATVSVGGTIVNVVTNYVLSVFPGTAATGTPAFTLDLGKPTPTAGLITVKPIAQMGTLPTGQYVAVVTVNGPGGSAVSPVTSPFGRVQGPAAVPRPTILP